MGKWLVMKKREVMIMSSIRIFFSSIKEGFVGSWKNKSMGFASIISICSMLIILGGITLGVFVANRVVDDMKTKVDQIDIILKPDVTDTRVRDIATELKNMDNIKDVVYVSKLQALEKMKEQWEDNAFLLEGMESALPESYEIKVEDIEKSGEVAGNVAKIDGVEKVVYYRDIVNRITKMSQLVKYVGIALVAVLLLVSFFIMTITIKLTVIARKKEINIKKYIGATNASITGPFIIEGMIFGFLGAFISFLIMYYGYNYFYYQFGKGNFLSNYLLTVESFGFYLSVAYLTIGVGIGVLASMFSSRRYMKV